MINNIEYYPCKKTCYQDTFCYLLFFCAGVWLCFAFASTPSSEISSSVIVIRWIFTLFGKTGLIVFLSIITSILGLVCFLNINAIIRCTIINRKFLPSDWEERKKTVHTLADNIKYFMLLSDGEDWKAIVNRDENTLPKEINHYMLSSIMKVTNLPQEQVSVLLHHSITPKGIIVFPDIECFQYVPVYFEPDNYYVYKTDQTIVFSVMDNKKLTSYQVEQSDVDFVHKCEKLADDIRKYPDKYQDALIEGFKPPVYEKNCSNNK